MRNVPISLAQAPPSSICRRHRLLGFQASRHQGIKALRHHGRKDATARRNRPSVLPICPLLMDAAVQVPGT
jgi:hypothetical protein